MDEEDFNSSDDERCQKEIQDEPLRGVHSLEKILETAVEDRIKSKHAVKNLKWGTGSPSAVDHALRWRDRFNFFRIHTLKLKNIDKEFDGDDLIRFFTVIVPKLTPKNRHYDAKTSLINETTIVAALIYLINYGHYTYPDFVITKHHSARIKTWFNTEVAEGRLMRGRGIELVRLGATVIARMVRTWLESNIIHGCRTWDHVLYKLFGVILVSSLAARAGDVALSPLYKGLEYLKWKDVTIYVDCDTDENRVNDRAVLSRCKMAITLHYMKEHKATEGVFYKFFFSTMKDATCSMVYPITLMLIHALRHGLVHGTSIEQVLDDAWNSKQKKIRWVYPDYPVICALAASKPYECFLDRPANGRLLLHFVRDISLTAGLLINRPTTHALRRGAAQDAAHLKKVSVGQGQTTDEVAQSLRHTDAAKRSGVTQNYVGDPTRENWNDRIENRFLHWDGPKLAKNSIVKAMREPISNEEVAAFQASNGFPAAKDAKHKKVQAQLARTAMRRVRMDTIIEEAEVMPQEEMLQLHSDTISSMVTSFSNCEISDDSTREKPCDGVSDDPARVKTRDDPPIDPTLLDKTSASIAALQTTDDDNDEGNDEELADAYNTSELENLISPSMAIHSSSAPETSLDITAALSGNISDELADATSDKLHHAQLMLSDTLCSEDEEASIESRILNFVRAFSKINVMKHSAFGIKCYAQQRGVQTNLQMPDWTRYPLTGNSRDPATPFVYTCRKTPGCQHRTILNSTAVAHEESCKTENVLRIANRRVTEEGGSIKCPQCDQLFTCPLKMQIHIHDIHDWVPQKCPVPGCKRKDLISNRRQFLKHQRMHTGAFPTLCKVVGCTSTKTFSQPLYIVHLASEHDIIDPGEITLVTPGYLDHDVHREWLESTMCPIKDCKRTSPCPTASHLMSHLKANPHKMTKQAASDLVESLYEVKTYGAIRAEIRLGTRSKALKHKTGVQSNWFTQRCNLCPTTGKFFAARSELVAHMTAKHKLTKEKASEQVSKSQESLESSLKRKRPTNEDD